VPTLIADGTSLTYILLSWTAPIGGIDFTGYQLQKKFHSGTGWDNIGYFSKTTNDYTDYAISIDIKYDYRIRTISGEGSSPWGYVYYTSLGKIISLDISSSGAQKPTYRWFSPAGSGASFDIAVESGNQFPIPIDELEGTESWLEYASQDIYEGQWDTTTAGNFYAHGPIVGPGSGDPSIIHGLGENGSGVFIPSGVVASGTNRYSGTMFTFEDEGASDLPSGDYVWVIRKSDGAWSYIDGFEV
jgi:hypothetical protein